MRQAVLLLFTALSWFVSSGMQQAKEGVYHDTYVVGEIPNLKSFETYSELEIEFDSLGSAMVGEGGFSRNRTRIFTQSFSNGKQSSQDPVLYKGLPLPCYCDIKSDTLTVKAIIGFFGGVGFETKIYRGYFQSSYILYIDDVKPYKYNPSDKDFTSYLHLKSKFQSLVLNVQPGFKSGEQVTGYLTFTSPDWYEKVGHEMDINYIKGSLHFTCITKGNYR